VDSADAEAIEEQMSALRAGIRDAVLRGDRKDAGNLRRDLAQAELDWEAAISALPPSVAASAPDVPAASLLPLREQVHSALSLLRVPARPAILAAVHEAFFAGRIENVRMTSLRRDEERSFRSAPYARPFYICASLGAGHLAPVRGLLCVSTWPLARRVIGRDSPRVDHLTAAISIAEAAERLPEPSPSVLALVSRFAADVRGGRQDTDPRKVSPQAVIRAARAELEEIKPGDDQERAEAAREAARRLEPVRLLFGSQPEFQPEPPRPAARARRTAGVSRLTARPAARS
jgi:hypothetical protein